jgi:hypothetical protein
VFIRVLCRMRHKTHYAESRTMPNGCFEWPIDAVFVI